MHYKKILCTTVVITVLFAFSFIVNRYSIEKQIQESLDIQEKSQQALEDIIEKKVFYIIDKGGEILEYHVNVPSDATVFSLLEDLSHKKDFEISFRMYPEMGVFVESIDNTQNGTDEKYWQYWVNGELPMVAADKMKVQESDRVEWKFEKIPF